MSEADSYELFDDQPTGFARWVAPALIISVLLHVIFYLWARGYPFKPFSDDYYDKIVPRTFQVDRVEIDPALLDPTLDEEFREAAAPEAVRLPDERIAFEEMMADVVASPAAPEIENPLLAEKPRVEATTLAQTVEAAESAGAPSVVQNLDSLREELLTENPAVTGRPLLELGDLDDDIGAQPAVKGPLAGTSTPGFSNLDGLLAQTGPLTDETAPILMPSDLLFDYDSYFLRAEALESIEKLGTLIQRNPQAYFVIEGHTDAFGSDEYNMELSRLRAESVKTWLVREMALEPGRIRTRGYGKTKLIAPADGTIEEQQINRRVEIVIRTRDVVAP